MTAAASWSSISASSRCSSVAYSWRRSLASASARGSDCSRVGENVGISVSWLPGGPRALSSGRGARRGGRPLWSLLLHHALQRMLVFACKVHHLRHLRFGDLVRENAAFADSVMVDVQHDA